MEPERKQHIDDLFHAALGREPAARALFLDGACEGDEEVRREVESLVGYYEQASDFIEAPVAQAAAQLLAEKQTRSLLGQQIGHYKILKLIGAGGMGEVYLAEDTMLGRRVAVKLLPAHFTTDNERVRRFQREARAASSLNHPNILTIYEIGQENSTHFIATEFIDGVTLREHMTSARLQITEALEVAVQVASALAAAHEEGIVHRDIKPENIMLRRRDSIVKVLDFGLAKLTEQKVLATDSEAATMQNLTTHTGVVMGTPYYMSPEQARGLAVDARTDIWSLGVVLYEMVTGHPPFEGPTTSDVIAKLLEREPASLADSSLVVPDELEQIVMKALVKDIEGRYKTAKDLHAELKRLKKKLDVDVESAGQPRRARIGHPATANEIEVIDVQTEEQIAARRTSSAEYLLGEIKRHRGGVIAVLLTFVIGFTAVGLGVYRVLVKDKGKAPAAPLKITPFTALPGVKSFPAFSPDGHQIAFVWNGGSGDNYDIYVKIVDAGTPLRLTTSTSYDSSPTWSPDGRHIALIYDVPRNLSQCLRCKIAADPNGGNHAEAAKQLHRRTQSQDRVGSDQRATHSQRNRPPL